MNKSSELAILDKAISELGPESYLGPWLLERRQELDGLMKSDILPTISLADARLEAERILSEAQDGARAKLESAERNASVILADARKVASRSESELKQQRISLAASLERTVILLRGA